MKEKQFRGDLQTVGNTSLTFACSGPLLCDSVIAALLKWSLEGLVFPSLLLLCSEGDRLIN